VQPTRQTLERFLVDDWLPAVRGSLEPSTWASYDRYLRLHVVPRIGAVPLQALDAGTLNKLYSALRADGGRRDGKPGGLSTRSARYVHTIVHRALKDAVAWDRLVRNPADAARPPRVKDARPPEMRTWTAQQLAEFLRLVEHSRYHAPWVFLATSGMRRGEALGLRWSDVDLERGRASIRQTITAVEHQVRVAPRTKTGGGRAVDLDAATLEMLRAHRARQAREFLLVGRRPQGDTLVFCRPDGEPYHPEHFSDQFDRHQRRLGFEPHISVHGLRHTWATLALQAGVPVKVVSERLGHSSTTITSDVYSHVTPTMQTDAAEKVAGLIFGGG
jgi:integrase